MLHPAAAINFGGLEWFQFSDKGSDFLAIRGHLNNQVSSPTWNLAQNRYVYEFLQNCLGFWRLFLWSSPRYRYLHV